MSEAALDIVGLDNNFGGLSGAALITLLPTVFQPFAAYKTLAEGAILVLAFQYLPDGIIGSLARLFSRRRVPSAAPAAVLAKGEAR